MLYITLEVLQCVSNNRADGKSFHYDTSRDSCAGVFLTGLCNNYCICLVGIAKLIVPALSRTTITRNQIISGKLPIRLQLVALLVLTSAVGNLYLYINRSSGKLAGLEKFLWYAVITVSLGSLLCAVLLELVSVLFFQQPTPATSNGVDTNSDERLERGDGATHEAGKATATPAPTRSR